MSKMSNFVIGVNEMFSSGYSIQEIATHFNVTLDMVKTSLDLDDEVEYNYYSSEEKQLQLYQV